MPDETNNTAGQSNTSGTGKVSVLPWVILLVVILAVLIGAVLFRDRIMPKNDKTETDSSTTTETPSGYQSVFLTNGQVYFGQIDSMNDQYLTLKDIYYLQLLPSNLQGQQQQANQQQQQGQLALRKLGKSGELHGPVDVMKINREQILYYQEITEEGEVMKAIRNYQKNPNGNQQQQAPANSQAPANNGAQPAPATNGQAPANNAPRN